jgi:CheY-like chemotaxis protein
MLARARTSSVLMVKPMPKTLVLVVDDDEDNAQMLEAVLAHAGFVVKTAASCAEARAVLEVTPVDALVTDYELGDGDALELLASLGPKRPRIAVLVTGHGRIEDKEKSRVAGFSAHLVKPIATGELERTLRAALATPTPAPDAM